MEAVDWSRESNFKKFYHRPTQKSAFTMGVLRGQDSSDSGESGTDQVDSLHWTRLIDGEMKGIMDNEPLYQGTYL